MNQRQGIDWPEDHAPSDDDPHLGELSSVESLLWTLGWRPEFTVALGAVGAVLWLLVTAVAYANPGSLSGDALVALPGAVLLLFLVVPVIAGLVSVWRNYERVTGAFERFLTGRREGHVVSAREEWGTDPEAHTVVTAVDGILPSTGRRASHFLVGQETVRVVSDCRFDLRTRRANVDPEVRDLPTEEIEAVVYEDRQVAIQTESGTRHTVAADSRPDELLAAIEARTRRQVLDDETDRQRELATESHR